MAPGGAAFALCSVAFVYGQVAMMILLYALTPVWGVMIGRFLLGWPVAPLRVAAIGLGLTGFVVMLAADGTWPVPEGPGEWMGLAAGVLWWVGTILGLLWATARLEPARVGILLLTEVAVGAGSAA